MSLPTLEQTPEKVPAAELADPPKAAVEKKQALAAQGPLYSDTETYSREVLGTGAFELYRLVVAGIRGDVMPWGPHPEQSANIIDTDEGMRVGLIINFNRSPLAALLICLGIDICANFHFEGFGGAAAEKDLEVCIKSTEGQFRYWVGTQITPQDLGLNAGYYQVAATVKVGPVTHKCGQYVFGYGYLGEARVQIANQPFA